MLDWIIINSNSAHPLDNNLYESEGAAGAVLKQLGEAFRTLYKVVPLYEDGKWQKVLLEGFKRGDLEGILLPQFSIDVYVPSDAKTDHIVVGFLIKGVPEAVFPFKNYCQYCHGVKAVDYGDSDTLPNTSIVYVEFSREEFEVNDLFELVDQVCRLANISPEDFSVNYPNSNKSYPYSQQSVRRYFGSRDRDKNRLAQWKASHERTKQIQKELEDELENGAIGRRFGGGGASGAPAAPKLSHGHTFKHLQHPNKPLGRKDKVKTEIDIPETIKASIVADAKRNKVNHQVQWKDFDTRWAQRLHVPPNRISTIRKTIYDRG
jgi:hypothetical protein